ncbi:hypothetical protein MBLNU457_g2902t1 [Dothideomycetes sp. NU457]
MASHQQSSRDQPSHSRHSATNDVHSGEPGDLLNGLSSASSLQSTASSNLSLNSQATKNNARMSSSTPLTSYEDSPSKVRSPVTAEVRKPNGSSLLPSTVEKSRTSSQNASPLPPSSPQSRPEARPRHGETKGYRAVWDPELDNKLGKEEKRKLKPKLKQFGEEAYEPDPPPDPRLAIVGYSTGNCTPKTATCKSKLRIAPYVLKPHPFDAKTSIGPGPPEQICVVGFDPFTPESQLKAFLGSYGEIAELHNQTDPSTGSFLGICSIKYRDSKPVRGVAVSAAQAAKRAETEGNGERIGLNTIKVERDREGRKCQRHVEQFLKKARQEQEAEQERSRPKFAAPAPSAAVPSPAQSTQVTDSPGPPLNAPKGPSGKGAIKPPEGPRAGLAPRGGIQLLVEQEPILSKIKRKPYIFIPNASVPVLGTTIPHMKKRLKAFDWKEVRLDQTGYYVIFDDSKRGEDETVRCFNECNNQLLFTYTMNMECQQYGNPDYERSPTPERAVAEQRNQEERERLQRDEDEDVEVEKKHRADNLDPVKGALDQLRNELRAKIMDDIKSRVAIPTLYDCLDPARHVAKRRKLGLSDTLDAENKAPSLLLNKALETPPGTPRSRRPLSHSKPLRPHDPNSQRNRGSTNAYLDERRKNRPAPRARPLHFRLQDMFRDEEDDSDDERKTSMTRDTDEMESRPMSRASTVTPMDSESGDATKHKRRKSDHAEQLWDADEEQETFERLHKQLLGDLLQKRPEDMATRELELIVNTLPRNSKFLKRAKNELFYRQRARFDDELFNVKNEDSPSVSIPSYEANADGIDPDAMAVDAGEVAVPAVKEKPKRKRKTKKQILEEQEALKAETKAAIDDAESAIVEDSVIEKLEEKAADIVMEDEEEEIDLEPRAQVEWGASADKPRRTVEDEDDLVLDIDGWQHLVKDEEDLRFLRSALLEEASASIRDPKLWAWKQKDIKSLNAGGASGPISHAVEIPGYYIPNATGSARTEGTKKILNSEKSKYLPHHIRVRKAREERQALAQKDPSLAVEAVKQAAAAKVASTATSRSNRANNRRLVNDINLQKQSGAGIETDAFRFNQLKKRKKLVKFDRSAIHGWGLYAEENIVAGDLIIEYVGEKIRQKVADMREIRYEKQGVGSSYLFRMVDDEIVDATKKGGIARFINHSCTPNCTAKIIKVEGTRRIVIYALKDVAKNAELTYDYKFEREFEATDRIPCLCGSVGCKGFLN